MMDGELANVRLEMNDDKKDRNTDLAASSQPLM